MRRVPSPLSTILAIILVSATLWGCGADDESARTEKAPPPASADDDAVASGAHSGPLALVATDTGLAAVPLGSSTPRWSADGGVAALDGTAAFSARKVGPNDTELSELDVWTGEVLETWSLRGDLQVNVVAPGGAWVALTDRPDDHASYATKRPRIRRAAAKEPGESLTALVVFDPSADVERVRHDLNGDVLPEAFSVDGSMLFTLRYYEDHYRVETVDVATGEQSDTLGRDKKSGEDMHGSVVRGVMTPDRSLVATLYRNPDEAAEPAFVHVVDLIHGWAYCADLTAPFGTGVEGTDEIVGLDTGAVAVVHWTPAEPKATVAHIDVDALHNPHPETPIAVTLAETNDPPALPDGVTSVPGYRHFVSLAG